MMADPSGDHDGKVPDSTMRRGLPPSAGITQIEPPISGWSVPYIKKHRQSFTLERAETKAICLPSGEKAGCISSAGLLVRLMFGPPETCLRKISKLPARSET